MGQGDVKPPFRPSYKPILCAVQNREFSPCLMHDCKEPHVMDRYGTSGHCMVSIYVCRKCKYKDKHPLCGALGCKYGTENATENRS